MKDTQRTNAVLDITGESIWGLMTGLIAPATVLTVLLLKFQASNAMIGSLEAIRGASLLLPLLGIYLFPPGRKRKKRLVLWHLCAIIPFYALSGILCSVAGRMSAVCVRWLLVALYGGLTLSLGVVGAAWTDWLAGIFRKSIRGTIMGLAFCASALAGTLGALLAGRLINTIPGTRSFATLFYISTGVTTFSMIFFMLIKDPMGSKSEADSRNISHIFARFRDSLKDANFRSFLVGRILATCGFCILPFIAVYYTSRAGGGLSAGTIASFGAALTAGIALGSFALGRLGDKRGHKVGIILGIAAQTVTILVMLLTSGRASALVAYGCAGICVGSAFVSHYNMLFETCPHNHRHAHITIGSFAVGTGTIIAPLLAGSVADRFGLRVLFLISLVLSAAALGWFVLRVKEPRSLPVNSHSD